MREDASSLEKYPTFECQSNKSYNGSNIPRSKMSSADENSTPEKVTYHLRFWKIHIFCFPTYLCFCMQQCSCYTKQRWGSVSSKFLIVPNSRMQTYGKNSKAQRRPTNCTFALNSTEWRILTLLSTILISLKLKALHRFTSTATAVEDITALQGGKLGKGLKQFLTDEVINKGKGKESLVVVDQNLGECAPGVCSSSEFRSAFTQDVRFRRN